LFLTELLPVSVTLVFSFRMQKFKQKSAILAWKIEEFRGAIFFLTENTTMWYVFISVLKFRNG